MMKLIHYEWNPEFATRRDLDYSIENKPHIEARAELGVEDNVETRTCCAQHTGMHMVVVEALLIAIYLGDELLLIDIRKRFRSSTCLVRYSWSLSG
jgi:hypothetical protein